MKQIFLIRHGKTKGNLERRYIGSRTDESLCREGILQLKQLKEETLHVLPPTKLVYVSPLHRARQTAGLLFPDATQIPVEALREIDFGDFENKNYEELNGDPAYQHWIDQGGKSDYPHGEGLEDFVKRSLQGLQEVLRSMDDQGVSETIIVCHGGNIMAILSFLTGKDYFAFQIGNAEGYLLEIDNKEKEIDLVSYHRI